MLGERLFPLIQQMQPDLAGKITGMLLEIDNTELLHMLESRESLKAKVCSKHFHIKKEIFLFCHRLKKLLLYFKLIKLNNFMQLNKLQQTQLLHKNKNQTPILSFIFFHLLPVRLSCGTFFVKLSLIFPLCFVYYLPVVVFNANVGVILSSTIQ